MELNQKLSNRYSRDRSITFWYAQRSNAPEEAMAAILDLKKQVDGESTGNALYEKEYFYLFQSLPMLIKVEGVYQPFIENGFVPIVVDLYGKTEDVLFGSILLDTLYVLLKTAPAQLIPELRKIKDFDTKIMKWWGESSSEAREPQAKGRLLLERRKKKKEKERKERLKARTDSIAYINTHTNIHIQVVRLLGRS